MHARQTIKKVKAALRTKFANGLHIGAYAPIGYMRDPEQRGHLLIDPDTRRNAQKNGEFYLFAGLIKFVEYG